MSQKKNGKTKITNPKEKTEQTMVVQSKNQELVIKNKERKNEEVRNILSSTNGEFNNSEREIFRLYLFEDREDTDVMIEMGKSPDQFWQLVDSCTKKMREYVRNFNF